MSGERASKTRMRLDGRICAMCGRLLDMPKKRGERVCPKCEDARKPKRKVYMHFMQMNGWYCQFLEEDLRTQLPCKLNLDDPAKIMELARRGGAPMKLEDKQAIEYGIENGRGSVWLNLTQ
jgi:hypothetical protein